MHAVNPTRTLPIIYVNTKDGEAIKDTETQIPATVYIDSVISDYPSLGSETKPLSATIRGRGNYTWARYAKKPYKLKFDTKTKVLGMPKNRHWCLMASADDKLGFLKMPAGFYISQALGLRWTPRMRPVELVLNDQYQGIYFLTEHVRIASNRVHVVEQAENGTNPDSITGGWLVEIDNYAEQGNITFTEGNGQNVMITIKEPEVLSTIQRNYIRAQIFSLNDALYASDFSSLNAILDITEAAKYYLVQEIMEDCESYHGSCYMYKDLDSLGVQDKWKFGPVWDFGNAYNRHKESWIYVNPSFTQYWIGQLATWPEFQQAVQEQWYIFYHEQKDSVRMKIQEFAATITPAAQNDADAWKYTWDYNDNSDMSHKLYEFLSRYDWRINWLFSKWGEGIRPATWDIVNPSIQEMQESTKILRDGQLFILRNGRIYDLSGRVISR